MAFTKEQHAENYRRKKQDPEWYAKHKAKSLEQYHLRRDVNVEKKRKYREANREKIRQQSKIHEQNRPARKIIYRSKTTPDPIKQRENVKQWRVRNPVALRLQWEHKDANRYGLTLEKLREVRKATHCEICKTEFTTTKHKHVDHCHKTQQYRGMLCHKCNVGLGHFKDDPHLLMQAITYLQREKDLPQ